MVKKNNKKKTEKVLVALSGGVDSSVAALLLKKQGYDITGAFMVNYEDGLGCWREDYQDALRVAAKLNMPLLKLDFTKEYEKFVLDFMFLEYEAGRTPNPDVLCNKLIKFGVWLKKAQDLGFNKLATGHYARVEKDEKGRCKLMVGHDKAKDQTYFLHQLNQEQLSHTLFPISRMAKKEVREMAKEHDLPTAEKEESMGICFVGEVPMKDFLMKRIKPSPGKIVLSGGEVIGEHDGLPFYTIGQRRLKILNFKTEVRTSKTKPLYVVEKNFKANELIVGYADDPLIFKQEITVNNLNWISGQALKFPLQCKVRLRHGQELQDAERYLGEAKQFGKVLIKI